MIGVVFRGTSRIELKTFPDPDPGPGEVVLQIQASGICGSDLHIFKAHPGPGGYASLDPAGEAVIAGHEPCGVVVARGPGVTESQAPTGMRAICFHYAGCGQCMHCWGGRPQLCDETIGYGGTGHGGHAEYLVVPASTLVPLREELTFAAGACIACGTGTAYGALKRLPELAGATIAVFGQGPVGASVTLLAGAMGARVIAVEPNPARRALATTCGADVVLDPSEDDVDEAIRAETRGRGCPGVIETSGASTARVAAVRATSPEGAVVLVGLGGGSLELDLDREVILAPRAILGSRTFSIGEMAECVDLVADRRIPVDSIVSGSFRLEHAQEAYDSFAAGTAGKYLLMPAGTE